MSMRHKSPESLQKLTNDFLENFFIEAHRLEYEETTEEQHKRSLKDSKSFSFNYTLVDCILKSNYVLKEKKTDDHPLIGMGFGDNINKGLFNLGIQGSVKNVLTVLDNIDKQHEDLDDYCAELCDTKTEEYVDNNFFNPDWSFSKSEDETIPFYISKTRVKDTKTFTINNSRSGRINIVKVVFIDGEFEQYELWNNESTYLPVLTVKLELGSINDEISVNGHLEEEDIPYYEVGEFGHYKYIADINSFYSNLDQVLYGIQCVLKNEEL